MIFLFVILGSASAYTPNYSSNGKIVDVYKNNVAPNVGKNMDDQGRYISDNGVISCSGYYWSQSGSKIKGKYHSLTFSGYLKSSEAKFSSGIHVNTTVVNLNFFSNGKYYAKCNFSIIKNLEGMRSNFPTITPWGITYGTVYKPVKITEKMYTKYANGNSRTSTIVNYLKRNDDNTLLGYKISGKSVGYEKINSRVVKYNGFILIKPRFNTVTGWCYGTYHEVMYSTSSQLIKIIPFESIFFDMYLQGNKINPWCDSWA